MTVVGVSGLVLGLLLAGWLYMLTINAQKTLTRAEQCLDGIDQLLGNVTWHGAEPAHDTQPHRLDMAKGMRVGRHAATEGGARPLSHDLGDPGAIVYTVDPVGNSEGLEGRTG